MPNYFKVTGQGIVEVAGATIEGEGKKGPSNAAEQYVSKTLDIPVENIKEISKEEFDKLDSEK